MVRAVRRGNANCAETVRSLSERSGCGDSNRVTTRLAACSTILYAYRNHLDLPFYVTEDEDVPESMHLNQYPSTFIYARDGSIAAQHAGAGNWSDESVIQFIEQLRAQ